MTTILVLGGSVAGLASAVMLARAGHQVTVLERDGWPTPAGPLDAAVTRRPLVPKNPHLPGMNAAARRVLLRRLPDVLEGLRYSPRGQALEQVLDLTAERQVGVELRRGQRASQLIWDFEQAPRVVGVRTQDGATVYADLVLDASGRGSRLREWTGSAGVTIPELDLDLELTVHTRFVRLRPDSGIRFLEQLNATYVPLEACDLYAFRADHGVVAIGVSRHPQDRALTPLETPAAFDAAVATVPQLAPFVDPERVAPLSGVHVMSGRRATFRRMVPGGMPVLTGLVPVGDALATTNPTNPGGLMLALLHAEAVAEALGSAGESAAGSVAPDWIGFRQLYRRLDALTEPVWYRAYQRDCARIDRWRRSLGLPAPSLAEPSPSYGESLLSYADLAGPQAGTPTPTRADLIAALEDPVQVAS